VILRQGFSLLAGAWGDLTDASVSPRTRRSLQKTLEPLLEKSSFTDTMSTPSFTPSLLAIRNLRARHAGSMIFVDLVAEVDGTLSVVQASALERKIEETLRKARKEIAEVRVSFRPAGDAQ